MRHPQPDQVVALFQADRHGTDALLEGKAAARSIDDALVQQHPARPDRRMAGERELNMWGEDPNLCGMTWVLCRQDERGL
jgi:hypothetical protein